jgi:hypothetical protein
MCRVQGYIDMLGRWFDKIVRNNFERRKNDDDPKGGVQEVRSNPLATTKFFVVELGCNA